MYPTKVLVNVIVKSLHEKGIAKLSTNVTKSLQNFTHAQKNTNKKGTLFN